MNIRTLVHKETSGENVSEQGRDVGIQSSLLLGQYDSDIKFHFDNLLNIQYGYIRLSGAVKDRDQIHLGRGCLAVLLSYYMDGYSAISMRCLKGRE